MQRYLIKSSQINNNNIKITGSDVHHIKNVMRMNVNDKVLAFDENKKVYLCEILNITDSVDLKILEEVNYNSELPVNVTIAHGLVKREKFEEVLRRLVELGCYKYQPVIMDKSIVRLDSNEFSKKMDRLEKIVKEASEQSERISLMEIGTPITFKELASNFASFDCILFCHVARKDDLTLKSALNSLNLKGINNILVIIGPESGFSPKEVEIISKSNALFVSLGKRVLRTETAPLYAMSVIASEVENA